MTTRTLLVALLALTAGLAGCIEGAQRPDDALAPAAAVASPSEDVVKAVNATTGLLAEADAPVWTVGDAWSIVADFGGAQETSVLAVTSAGSGGYVLSATSESMATYDAVYDVSYVGRIRASDLAGHQQDQPVRFFDFPLSDGKTWTAKWDGMEVVLTAKASPSIATPEGSQPGFLIEGKAGDAVYVTYDYVPALRWWSQIRFAEGYGFRVDRAMTNWTGSYLASSAKLVHESHPEAPGVKHGTGTFAVDEGQTSLMLTVMGGASAYVHGLVLVDPSGAYHPTTTSNLMVSPAPDGFFFSEPVPATPGEWRISAPAVFHPDGWFHAMVHQVLIEQRAL